MGELRVYRCRWHRRTGGGWDTTSERRQGSAQGVEADRADGAGGGTRGEGAKEEAPVLAQGQKWYGPNRSRRY